RAVELDPAEGCLTVIDREAQQFVARAFPLDRDIRARLSLSDAYRLAAVEIDQQNITAGHARVTPGTRQKRDLISIGRPDRTRDRPGRIVDRGDRTLLEVNRHQPGAIPGPDIRVIRHNSNQMLPVGRPGKLPHLLVAISRALQIAA